MKIMVSIISGILFTAICFRLLRFQVTVVGFLIDFHQVIIRVRGVDEVHIVHFGRSCFPADCCFHCFRQFSGMIQTDHFELCPQPCALWLK